MKEVKTGFSTTCQVKDDLSFKVRTKEVLEILPLCKFLKLSKMKLAGFKDQRESHLKVFITPSKVKMFKDINKPKKVSLMTQTKSAEKGGKEY